MGSNVKVVLPCNYVYWCGECGHDAVWEIKTSAVALDILWQDEQCEMSLHGERVVVIVCACDVIQTRSSMGSIGPFGTVRPQESASAHHGKMHESRILLPDCGVRHRGLTSKCV